METQPTLPTGFSTGRRCVRSILAKIDAFLLGQVGPATESRHFQIVKNIVNVTHLNFNILHRNKSSFREILG